MEGTEKKTKKPLCRLSVAAFVLSLTAAGFYFLILYLKAGDLLPVLDVLALASLILPPVAKRVRISRQQSGKAFEIAAVVIGGFAFAMAVVLMPAVSIYVAYLGWIIGGIAYRFAGKE